MTTEVTTSQTIKTRFRCTGCGEEWPTYNSCYMHIRRNEVCRAKDARVEGVRPDTPPKIVSNKEEGEALRQLNEQVSDEEIEKPNWPGPSMAQRAASQPIPDWVDEEGIELPPFPEDYRPPERDVSAVSLIARGQAIVLDAIEIAAYEAWCREGWEGSLKQWVSECIAGYFTMLGIEITAFSVPQPQREYILAKAGLKDASG